MYYIRLDDAAEQRNIENWERIEKVLDSFGVKPLVGVIPHSEDCDFSNYPFDNMFWTKVTAWAEKGWIIALHGFNHVCVSKDGGINPVHHRSEFAGLSLDDQKEKISKGLDVFKSHNIDTKVFIAPSHTFDENTLVALKECSDIRFISDTIANKRFYYKGFVFVPQQSGKVRKMHLKEVTFCYHPNTMNDKDFEELESFIRKNIKKFNGFSLKETKRKKSLYDKLLSWIYFKRRK